MIPCVPEHAIIVIMNFGTMGNLLDSEELLISNGKIDVEKLVSLLPQTFADEDSDEWPWSNYIEPHLMN